MNINLAEINFDKYCNLLIQMCSSVSAFIVYDLQGELIWKSKGVDSIKEESIRLSLVEKNSKHIKHLDFTFFHHGKNIDISSVPLNDENTKPFGLIAAIRETNHHSSITTIHNGIKKSLSKELQSLATCIVDEQSIIDELESMMLDLSERYEELNLIYNSDDDINPEKDGQNGLNKLVSSCVDFINVSMAALILPEKNVTLVKYSSESNPEQSYHFADELVDSLVQLTRKENQPIVINNSRDYINFNLQERSDYKLISVPIRDANNACNGCIIVTKDQDNKDFSNSDRNLLLVMAKKAGKILQATYDNLTGLLTRSSFETILDELMECDRPEVIHRSLLILNIEQMNIVNDLYGLKAGDALIQHFAHIIENELRSGDQVARLSGDEFGVLLNNCSTDKAKAVGIKLKQGLQEKLYHWDQKQIDFSFRTGIVPVPVKTSGRYLLNAADAVMSIARQNGHNSIEVYRQDNERILTRKKHIVWANKIQQALREDRFRLVCQGIYYGDTSNKTVHHYEVLLRMLDDDGNYISPFQFLPAAESYRLMPIIDEWVIKRVIQLLTPYAQQLESSPLTWAVNLSGQSISNTAFRKLLINELKTAAIPTSCLGFEVTESSTIDSISKARELIESIKSFGCSIYLDDFGTGLSSFSYMKMLPFDYIKIDGSFIKKILSDPISYAMVKAISDVVKAMNLHSIAEFVEYEEDVDVLNEIGVDFLQGYLLHKPENMKTVLQHALPEHSQINHYTKAGL